jgi:hypothetical protein
MSGESISATNAGLLPDEGSHQPLKILSGDLLVVFFKARWSVSGK